MKKRLGKLGLMAIICLGIMSCKQGNTEKTSQKTTQNVLKDEEVMPNMDEFIEFEKEPTVDIAELSKNIVYPEDAKRDFLEGKVVLSIYIDKFGKVKKVVVRESTSTIFNNAAIDAVNKTKFSPAIQKGQPVACWIQIPIIFKLK